VVGGAPRRVGRPAPGLTGLRRARREADGVGERAAAVDDRTTGVRATASADAGARSWCSVAAPPVSAAALGAAARVDLATVGWVWRAALVAVLFCASAVLAATPGLALLSVLARRRRLGPAGGLGVMFAGAGATAMGGFWCWFVAPDLGRAFSVAALLVSVGALAATSRRGDLRRLNLSVPLSAALLVGLVFTGIAFLRGGVGGDAAQVLALRYWLAPDSQIPLWFATQVAAHRSLHGAMFSGWLYSDRPPLQTGFVLLQWPLWGRPPVPYQLLGTALQMSWLPALWVVLRGRGYGTGRVLAVVLSTAATGAVFFNSVYVWPKMLAGALALAAFALLVTRDRADREGGTGVVVAALATLSLLAHGGTAFALLALIPFAVVRYRHRWRTTAVCGAVVVAGALYLPWMAFQRFVDPPGNRLLKWQLAGDIPIDHRGFGQTLVEQYRALSLVRLFENKLDNVVTLVASPALWRVQTGDPGWHGVVGTARVAQMNDLVMAAGPLLLGFAALAWPSARRALADALPLATFTALTVVVWVVLLFGGTVTTVIHQGPYAAVVLFIALAALAATCLPRPAALAVLGANAVWFVLCWAPGWGLVAATGRPLTSPVDPAMVLVAVLGLGGLALVVATALTPDGRPGPFSRRRTPRSSGGPRRRGTAPAATS
jgi:hypothetical protein